MDSIYFKFENKWLYDLTFQQPAAPWKKVKLTCKHFNNLKSPDIPILFIDNDHIFCNFKDRLHFVWLMN